MREREREQREIHGIYMYNKTFVYFIRHLEDYKEKRRSFFSTDEEENKFLDLNR